MLHCPLGALPKLVLAVITTFFILVSLVWGNEVPSYPPVTKGWRAAQVLDRSGVPTTGREAEFDIGPSQAYSSANEGAPLAGRSGPCTCGADADADGGGVCEAP